ncbi:DNA-binding protein [Paenibacillus enshidis]|uniref:DNA-binding protein n=1 Tax=Paenibacillus enshidis TaxID=1458439 RepID=A0ABV5AVZ3_9BACL
MTSTNDKHPYPGLHCPVSGSLITEIEAELKRQDLTLNDLAQRSGINRGIITSAFTSIPPKSLSIKQLDLISLTLQKPEGWLYELYTIVCFDEGRVHWKKLKAFLLRCVELDRNEIIQEVLSRLMESAVHVQDIFDLAETLYADGKKKAAIPFYECVCAHEIKQHSERLAISQYKLFRARLGVELSHNLESALRYYPFRNRLPDHFMLDGLLQLANVFFTLHRWDEVFKICDEMKKIVLVHMKSKESLNTERHLVVYYAQSFMLKGNALEWMERYEEAFEFIAGYEDLHWFPDLDDLGAREVSRFQMFAKGNRLNLLVLLGHQNILLDYIDFLNEHPDEWLPGLLTIMTAANRHKMNVDHILPQFQERIHGLRSGASLHHTYYQSSSYIRRASLLFFELGVYEFDQQRFGDGIEWILEAFEKSIASNNKDLSMKSAAYMEIFRKEASAKQQEAYLEKMKGVINDAKAQDESSSSSVHSK